MITHHSAQSFNGVPDIPHSTISPSLLLAQKSLLRRDCNGTCEWEIFNYFEFVPFNAKDTKKRKVRN
jgi:hypothetical protein